MKYLFAASLLTALLPGCVLHHVSSDPDAERFASVWETPRLEQQRIVLDFRTQGPCDGPRLFRDATAILLDSAKFRPTRAGEAPTARVELTVRVHRETHAFTAVCGGLVLYLWPIDVQDVTCEVFGVVRRPSGELVGRCYAQGRGRRELWLGYLFWPRWLSNSERADVICRDTLKAATVKMARVLMPKAKKP